MKKWLSLLFAISLLVGCSNQTTQTTENQKEMVSEFPTYEATVERVTDGDTLTVQMKGKKEKIRLLLIDTPESVKEGVDPQPFSIEASDFLKKLLPSGTKVIVEPGVEGHEYDRYNRLLAYVYVDGEMVNKKLVQEGFARVGYIYEPNTRYLEELKQVQASAKSAKKNIWSIDGYVTDKGYNVGAAKRNSISSNQQTTESTTGKIKGNKNGMIYHVPSGKYYNQPMKNIEWFDSTKEAEQAGYRASKE